MNLKQALAKKLTKKELSLLKTSFDIVGSIAIIDIPEELEKKEKIIAEELLNLIKHVKTILKKTGIRYGKYRRQKLKFLIGERKKITTHKESNSRLKLNVETCYFSSRLSHDRLRIMNQVKPQEKILVMFSGIAPYQIVIARNTKVKEIIGVEFNPEAHKYALENLKLNKVENKIKLYCGDVKKIVPKLGKFDRILMPAPKNAENFLDVAKKASKKNTTIHFYCFATENELKKFKELIKQKFNCKILDCIKTNQHKPRSYRYRIDFKVL
ncbi:SAM-dependent methyltransferase [Candidatus Woesearchaeota archaeon CG10_big_fil_rev_8_21_14_0_10_30_7]|nr:MAG: SAM-dependent methyltransferase [Candidatus Woesearchaeota archaeon CG10_big_fil_rev_8_21_14_0_10_30_7]